VNVGSFSTLSPLGRGRGEGLAVVDLSKPTQPSEVTYAQLDAHCNAIAAGLSAKGLRRGDRVGILALNRTEYMAALYGTMRAGAVPVPLNIKLPAEALAFIARDADLRLIFVDSAHRKVAPPNIETVDFDADFPQFLKPGPFTAVEPAEGDICLQPYTSGSTGRPKGVLLTHAGQAWQIDALVRARRMTPEDRVLVAAPLYHKNALVWTKVCVAAGATIVLLARFDQRLYVESIGRYRVTRLSGVPTMFHLILGDPALAQVDNVGFFEEHHGVASGVGRRVVFGDDRLAADIAAPHVGEGRVGVDLLVEGAGLVGGGELELGHILVRDDRACRRLEDGIAARVVAMVMRVNHHIE